MATYTSPEVTLQASAETVFNKLSNLENLKSLLEKLPQDQIPEDKREVFNNMTITPDSLSIPGPMGNLTFRVTEKVSPTLIRLTGEGSPVPISLGMKIKPESENTSKAKVDIELEIPAMLKPMVGGHIQKMADQFGQVLTAIPF